MGLIASSTILCTGSWPAGVLVLRMADGTSIQLLKSR